MTTKESPYRPEQLRAAEDLAGEVVLHPRAVQFDFSRSPLHWIPGELVASHVISGLNLILPLGTVAHA